MLLLEKITAAIAPHQCLVCRREGNMLCQACITEAFGALPQRCYRCRAISKDSRTCASCRSSSRLGHVWVGTEYSGAAQELVRKFKFERARAAAGVISPQIAKAIPELSTSVIVTHVPTASSRVRKRGYDQAQLLTDFLSRQYGFRSSKLLIRVGQTRQVGARRSERLKQLGAAFRVRNPQTIKGAHVILIDDVLTTGATLEAAAKVLRESGARHVDAAVFAQG